MAEVDTHMGWRYSLAELAAAVQAEAPAADVTFHAVSTDTRTLQRGDLFVALDGERFDGNQFVEEAFEKGACAAVTRVPHNAGPCVVVDGPLGALQAFSAHHRQRHAIPILALTGSCGKTMAKDLTAAVLASKYRVVKTQGNLNNEIGCPLSLLQLDAETDFAVIEMGANHVGEIARLCTLARPTEAAITMIAPAHLDGFGTLDKVAEAKAEAVAALPHDGTFYVNADDEWCLKIAGRHPGRKVLFGRSGDVALKAIDTDAPGGLCLTVDPVGELRLPLVCRAHATNVLLAVAVGLAHGVATFERPLREAIAASTRIEVLQVGPLEVVDDSYNANPASMAAALDTLAERSRAGRRLAALGEMLELGAASAALHRVVGEQAGKAGVAHLFVRGPHAEDMVAGAQAAGVGHADVFEDCGAIAEAIRAVARPGDTLLVKGSRGMAMEHVVEALKRLWT